VHGQGRSKGFVWSKTSGARFVGGLLARALRVVDGCAPLVRLNHAGVDGWESRRGDSVGQVWSCVPEADGGGKWKRRQRNQVVLEGCKSLQMGAKATGSANHWLVG
jgi:hypothetical protein